MACLKDKELPATWKQEKLILLPKSDKDFSLPQSCRPISLLNVDYKLLASILTSRLNKFISNYIHADQADFIQHKQLRDNVRRLSNTIWYSQDQKLPFLLYSVGTEKAFDRVDWLFLKAVFERM